jgi:hypothetical protein
MKERKKKKKKKRRGLIHILPYSLSSSWRIPINHRLQQRQQRYPVDVRSDSEL